MLKIGQRREAQRIVLRAAIPPKKAVRDKGKIVIPATDGEPEAFIVMAPITPAMRRRAQHAVRRMLDGVEDLDAIDVDTLGDLGEEVSRELIRLGAVEWGGIGDAGSNPVELTPDRDTRFKTARDPKRPKGTIDQLLDDESAFETLDAQYVRADALRIAEKNGLSASLTGIGEAGTRGKGTASSRAARKATAGRRKSAARNARTPKTSSRPKRAKRSGKS